MRQIWARLRRSGPRLLPETRRAILPDVTSALPASAALARMRAALVSADQTAELVWLSAGERITPAGLSDLWEARWHLPAARASAFVDVGIDEQCDVDTEWHVRWLVVRLVPAPPANLLSAEPALPTAFHDSPAAVAALAAQGVDFVAGDSHTLLEATTLPTGAAVWRTIAWEREYQTPFGRADA